jgi:hypothetical protein
MISLPVSMEFTRGQQTTTNLAVKVRSLPRLGDTLGNARGDLLT